MNMYPIIFGSLLRLHNIKLRSGLRANKYAQCPEKLRIHSGHHMNQANLKTDALNDFWAAVQGKKA